MAAVYIYIAMTKSTLLTKFRSSSGSTYKKWVSESEGVFYSKVNPDNPDDSGRVSQQSFAGAHAHTGNLDIKIPNPEGGMMNVSKRDASRAGAAANWESSNEWSKDDTVFIESLGVQFTAEEFRQAYETQGNITGDVVQYL